MKNYLQGICMTLLALQLSAATAGEITNSCFNRGILGTCEQTVLQHVGFKSVVLQFVDPDSTHLGEGMARILWREILESIYDLPDAGVILATDRAGEIERALGRGDLGSFLQQDYHDAALAIITQQNAQMGIWGAVMNDGDALYVQTFLTLRQPENDPWMTLSMSIRQADSIPVTLSTVLGKTRINLPPLHKSRTDLFSRTFTTRCRQSSGCPSGIELREGPSNDARIVAHVPVGSRIEAVDMQQQWLKVRSTDGSDRWINLFHVEMFPEVVTFRSRYKVNLRDAPGGNRIGSTDLNGNYEVHDAARHGKYDEPWYQISANGRMGWVAGRLVSRRSYIFPGVHLIAGLYRYGRGQYDQASDELEAFIDETPEDDNVSRATALRFLAASRLADSHDDPSRVHEALNDLDSSVQLTPYDASGYTLRALVSAGSLHGLDQSIDDLSHALTLNHRDTGALQLLRAMSSASHKYDLNVFTGGYVTADDRQKFMSIEDTYLHRNRLH
jgi:SH3-like domain-containing protein